LWPVGLGDALVQSLVFNGKGLVSTTSPATAPLRFCADRTGEADRNQGGNEGNYR